MEGVALWQGAFLCAVEAATTPERAFFLVEACGVVPRAACISARRRSCLAVTGVRGWRSQGLSPEERAERLAGLQKTIMVDIK